LHMEQGLFDAMLSGWRSQQVARYIKVKTIEANESGVRRFAEHVACWPWEWRSSHVDEYFGSPRVIWGEVTVGFHVGV